MQQPIQFVLAPHLESCPTPRRVSLPKQRATSHNALHQKHVGIAKMRQGPLGKVVVVGGGIHAEAAGNEEDSEDDLKDDLGTEGDH